MTSNDGFKLNISNIEFPTFDEDCEFVDQCEYTTEDCFAGAPALINRRCSKERINYMLESKKKNLAQSINIEGSSNIQINQQGPSSTNNQQQTISITNIPTELIDEFKMLIESPSKNNRTKWVEFLKKLTSIGGTITTLIELFRLFSAN